MTLPALPPGLAAPAVTPAQPPSPIDRGAFEDQLSRLLEPPENPAAGTRETGPVAPRRTDGIQSAPAAASAPDAASPTSTPGARIREALGTVAAHQRRLDAAIAEARSGRTFSPAELLALQARTHRFAHDLNLVSKVVEQLSAGMKKTLETQL
jgi:hypothetical protein